MSQMNSLVITVRLIVFTKGSTYFTEILTTHWPGLWLDLEYEIHLSLSLSISLSLSLLLSLLLLSLHVVVVIIIVTTKCREGLCSFGKWRAVIYEHVLFCLFFSWRLKLKTEEFRLAQDNCILYLNEVSTTSSSRTESIVVCTCLDFLTTLHWT